MKKRIISFILTLCIVLTLIPMQVFAADEKARKTGQAIASFEDIKPDDWFYDAALYVRLNGIFNGTGDGSFDADGNFTRGMFVTVLGRLAGVDASLYSGAASVFSDVPANAYYAPYVNWAAKHGLLLGNGNGEFAPDDLINREQMAVLFVRYFETFDVKCETKAGNDTLPADIDEVSPYARDAVIKLWKMGILNGDGKNFNPKDAATRAQAAVICMNTDNAVETWYQEPGEPSERVKVELPKKDEPVISEEDDWYDDINYYEVSFALGEGCEQLDITLPNTAVYEEGTSLNSLPAPSALGMIFLGWYYDAALTQAVELGDTLHSSLTLYAKVLAGEDINAVETPNFVTVLDQLTSYEFKLKGEGLTADNVRNALSFTRVTIDDPEVSYSVSANGNEFTIKPSPALEEGQTYKVELINPNAIFVLDGNEQPDSVRVLNILTKKAEVKKASLNSNLIQIQKSDTDISDDAFNGLFQVDEQGNTHRNETSGVFIYKGNEYLGERKFQAGDTVAILAEGADLSRMDSNEGRVAYIKITSSGGAEAPNKYSFEMADIDDVLFMPDVLPIPASFDTDNIENHITILASSLAAIMRLAEADALDSGDFLGFYNDANNNGLQDESEAISTYGVVTGHVEYTDPATNELYLKISYSAATAQDVNNALDVYYTEGVQVELTDAEQRELEEEIKANINESDFPVKAALFAASVLIESDELEKIPEPEKVYASLMDFEAATMTRNGNLMSFNSAGNTAVLNLDWSNISVKLTAYKYLENLKDYGFEVNVKVPFEVIINNSIVIELSAQFEEEVLISKTVKTSKAGKDYRLTAGFVVGNYTGIKFEANFKTEEQNDESMTKKLDQIVRYMKRYSELNGVMGSDGSVESLADIYQNVMQGANETWLDIVNVKLFDMTGDAFWHIFCFQIKASFVVSANLCASMGLSFDYTVKKQYDFTIQVKNRASTNNTTELIAPVYSFDFYVVGTLGIRAGLRLEMYVGLFSLNVDKIGISAEVGAYARLWGYFFFNFNSARQNRTKYSGAVLIEIGMYLEVRFVAQLFSSSELTYNPIIAKEEWPLWSAGGRQNAYAFSNGEDENLTITNVTEYTLPSETFTMAYMDLKDGRLSEANKDDSTESNFVISFSSPVFSYKPSTNKILVNSELVDELIEEADMVIAWKPAALAFSSVPLKKVIHISYTCPEGFRCINFDSCGGSNITALVAKEGSSIIWPYEEPTKLGYSFGGWYKDEACSEGQECGALSAMPVFAEGETIMTLYAKWIPRDDTKYTVMHYQQSLGNVKSYELYESREFTGTTDDNTNAVAIEYDGFTPKSFSQTRILPDGSSVVRIYYDRNDYTFTFHMGRNSDYFTSVPHEEIVYHHRYGEIVDVPAHIRQGYTLSSWIADAGVPELVPGVTTATQDAAYTAVWTKNTNKVSIGGTNSYLPVITGDKLSRESLLGFSSVLGTLSGWYKDASCIIPWDFDNDIITCPTTIYPKWASEGCSVSFELNGGSNYDAHGVIVPWGGTLTYYAQAEPEKEGCTFAGWYTDEACTDGNEWSLTTDKVYGPLTLYAKWIELEYTVSFDTDGGTVIADTNVKWNETVSRPEPNPEKEHYIFDGWYKNNAYTIEWNFNSDKVLENTTIYVKWNKKSYTVTFNANGGSEVQSLSLEYDSLIPENDAKTIRIDHYDFVGWYKDAACEGAPWNFASDKVDGNITLYAKWVRHKHTVNFNTNGGTPEIESMQVPYGYRIEPKPDNPAKTGYTFAGWYSDSEYTDSCYWYFGQSNVTDDITLYAKWTPIEYTVSFESNGGTAVNSVKANYDTTIVAPNEPAKAGYRLEGWYKDVGCNEAWSFASDKVTGNITLYAKWALGSYTVEFNSKGGSMVESVTASGNSKIAKPEDPTKEGYDFAGWYSNYDTSGDPWDFETGEVTHNMTLYAKWTPKNDYCQIIFDTCGRGVAPESILLLKKPATFIPSAPAMPDVEGYRVTGWYKTWDPDNAEPVNRYCNQWIFEDNLDPGYQKSYWQSDVDGDVITLYAKWEKII